MATDGLTKADHVKMQALAGDIRKCRTQMSSSVENGKAQVDSLKSVWTGAAATDFYSQFGTLYTRCGEVLDIIDKMVNELSEAAETYSAAEKKMDNQVSELKKLPTFNLK